MRKFGLIGKKLGHSFSKRYFTEKFEKEQIKEAAYELYELEHIDQLKNLLEQEPELVGLNVTVPYKEAVLPFLDKIDTAAALIGAVNTISIKDGATKGFNTDYIGFKKTLQKFYAEKGKALVLGTGGASKAVKAALKNLDIPYTSVSRNPAAGDMAYEEINAGILQEYNLLINTTPLGMNPDIHEFPPLPYESLSTSHYLYDLVYNPEVTTFLQKGVDAGAHTLNGLEMLYEQAEAAWNIWNTEL